MRRESHLAAGVVLFRGDAAQRRYLLLRSARTRRPVWEFAKGGIEQGETEREAGERELQEETGIASGAYSVREGFRAEEHYIFTAGSGPDRSLISKRVTYFLAEAHTDEVRLSREATEFRWVSYDEAHRLLRFPEKRRVLQRAAAWLDGDGVAGA
ncbi:MAG TPA: NUDIX domain-containing protein [Longimicrobiaceae bacterium]|jgi:8-oxo-dGTP pyrophosphatase MutT (NUDIX family)|nr:NUDIX domain-containing protein [Longimicrobiaceae bacterium]